MNKRSTESGQVVLLGAGPGPIDWITTEGAGWLSCASVVVYDRLANPDLLKIAPENAELIYVGKSSEGKSVSQEKINRVLIEKSRAGALVVRLKGGDPLLFGRGGEEADALAQAGCNFRIVPGITAAIGAAATAGIPLTDRRFASSVALVTGHEDPGKPESSLDYSALSRIDTLVFYMGVGRLEKIVAQLIDAGKDPETPAAIIERASRPQQRVIEAPLAELGETARKANVKPPALIVVGRVVTLRKRIEWYEKLPLFGQTVLVTRTRKKNSQLASKLARLGAEVIEAPTIEIAPMEDPAPMQAMIDQLDRFDWIALTSPNGVDALWNVLIGMDRDARVLSTVRIAAVGSATADALRSHGLRADLVPDTFTTEALCDALLQAEPRGRRILLPRAQIASALLSDRLNEGGWSVVEIPAYRTIAPEALPAAALDALRSKRASWITFTSSSTVQNFFRLVGDVDLSDVKLAAIGPVTAQTLREYDVEPTVIADPHTIDGVVNAIREFRAS